MIERAGAEYVRQLAKWFPVVSITGPRQSGKSTLVKATFPDYDYVNLEDPQLRALAEDDPVGFVRNRRNRTIFDEAQYVPDLFSMVQVVSDERGEPGQFVLSGSQNFLMLKSITQSLAGRVGMMRLLPLSYGEALQARPDLTPDEFMLTGGYPRIYDAGIPPEPYFSGYVQTYLSRDVAGYLDVRRISTFRTFLGLLAQRCGNLLNLASLERDAQIAHDTARSWLSMLESSYIVFRLLPYAANLGKRLTKTPKIYFFDTGLLCHLLGIHTLDQLLLHPMLGAVFENLVIAERVKRSLNQGTEPSLFFYRDDEKHEVDLVDLTRPEAPELVEVKSTQTYRAALTRSLSTVGSFLDIPAERQTLAMRSDIDSSVHGIAIRSSRSELLGT